MVFIIAAVVISSGELIKLTECACPGDSITYNCVIIGSGYTIWQGSAFNCSEPSQRNQIVLQHSQFRDYDNSVFGMCNNGAIVGHSLAKNDTENTYISQLTITITSYLIGSTIECVHRTLDGIETTINSSKIAITG